MIIERIIKNLFVTLVLIVVFHGCTRISAEPVPIDTITVSVQPASASGHMISGNSSSVPYLENHWPSRGYAFYAFIYQDGKLHYSGVRNTKETSISGSSTVSAVTVEVPVHDGIDLTAPYTVFLADRSCEIDISEEGVFVNADLKRGLTHVSAYYISSGINKELTAAIPAYLTSVECVWLTNRTDKSVSIKHKGFRVSSKWFYDTASLRVSNEKSILLSPYNTSLDGGEQSSVAQVVLSGERGFILSQFIPNGKKAHNASIVLEIDGKDYYSPPFSSSVEFSRGELYFYSLTWDGEKLTWLFD